MTDLLREIKTAISLYGKNGDGSLEYIGLVISDGAIIDFRPYRKRNASLLQYIKSTQPFCKLVDNKLKPFLSLDGINLCDISESNVMGRQTFRMVFKLPQGVPLENMALNIDSFLNCGFDYHYGERLRTNAEKFCNTLSPQTSPLLQIGIETDIGGELVGIKYYLAFDKIDRSRNYIDYISRLEDIQSSSSYKKELFSEICSSNFTPIFVGFNDHGGIEEHKLYFISNAFGHQIHEILPATLHLAKILGWQNILSEDLITMLFQMGIYVEGVAMSFQHSNEWRLYLNALPRKHF